MDYSNSYRKGRVNTVSSRVMMSHHQAYLLDEEEPGDWNSITKRSSHHLLPYNNMTSDRGKGKLGLSTNMPNPYGTGPRHTKSTYAKLKSISTFAQMYFNNKEASIAEEELKYLKGAESGDLDVVRAILQTEKERGEKMNKPDGEESSVATTEIPGNSVKNQAENGTLKPEETVVEVVGEINEVKPNNLAPLKTTKSRASLWSERTLKVLRPTKKQQTSPVPVRMRNIHPETGAVIETEMTSAYPNVSNAMKIERFNKNCRDQWGRSALFIAMLHQNMEMMELLLDYTVEIEDCLYHAIDFGYYNIVELFMRYDKQRDTMISGEDSFYPTGLTPIQLAAHKNDYVMLKILHSSGYRIESKKKSLSKKSRDGNRKEKDEKSVLERAWDNSNNQILYYRAMASPAYQVMMFTEGQGDEGSLWDFLDNIFSLYRKLKKKASDEPSARSLYLPLANQVEDFACDLLSEVRSPCDLADLLRFDVPGPTHVIVRRNYLAPLQRSFEVRMKEFVAHDNAQLALTCLRLGTVFGRESSWKTLTWRIFLGLIFPVLSVAFILAPNTKFGRLILNPTVNFSCHMVSELAFVLLMILRLVIQTYERCDCLGMRVSVLDWFILIWVIARLFNQFNKFKEASIFQMVTNIWRVNDLSTCFLFVVVIGLKIYDVIRFDYVNCLNPSNTALQQAQCDRNEWSFEESWHIVISEACLAGIFLLIHIRAMELLYIDRTFGPLQLSLDKMLVDTIRFLFIFAVTFFAFACAMTQLYWPYGTPRLYRINNSTVTTEVCRDEFTGTDDSCTPVYSSILNSVLEQYWTLYGYGWGSEPPVATGTPGSNTKAQITMTIGQLLSMLFHLWAVVVMLNMLIAMMSHSFDRVRDNAEIEWKYHRSGMWMKFMKRGIYPRPPPMNLIPSPQNVKDTFLYCKKFFLKCTSIRSTTPPNRGNAKRSETSGSITKENRQYKQAITRIVNRYMRKYLLPDFRHDEVDACPLNRTTNNNSQGRKESTALIDDI